MAGMEVTAAGPARRQRTPSADVERELLAAAEAVLVQEGPGGLTIRAVATRAAIAPMGVYSRLGGKDGLVDALLIRGFDRLRAAVESRDEPDLLERLRASGVRYREFALANRQFYAIMFGGAIPHDHPSDELAEHAAAAFDALGRNVETAAAAGRIVAEQPREAAQQIWSAVHGAMALELGGQVLTPDPEATYRGLLDLLFLGLIAR
jgi:AcrR family transcriptional regulator